MFPGLFLFPLVDEYSEAIMTAGSQSRRSRLYPIVSILSNLCSESVGA